MSLPSSADNENQLSLHMVLSLTRYAGAGRHPSDPPHLDTDLRRDDGPRVTISPGRHSHREYFSRSARKRSLWLSGLSWL